MSMRESLREKLLSAKYSERPSGIFTASVGKRSIIFVDALPNAIGWPKKVDDALKPIGLGPAWSCYLILLIEARRSRDLALAAAAFCRDVSRCRRLVAFMDDNPDTVIPFLALPVAQGGSGNPGYDFRDMVRNVLDSPVIAEEFLDIRNPLTRIQQLAEDGEFNFEK
jgi:hypothetical protein